MRAFGEPILDDLRPEVAEKFRIAKRADEGGAFDAAYRFFFAERVRLAAEARARGKDTDGRDLAKNKNRYRGEVKRTVESILGRSVGDAVEFVDIFRQLFGFWPGAAEFGRPR